MNIKEEIKTLPPEKQALLEEVLTEFGRAEPDEESDGPPWIDTDGSVDEAAYCQWMTGCRPMKCLHDQLYDADGCIPDAAMNRTIMQDIMPYVRKNLAKKVTALLSALKILCAVNDLPIQEDRIHFKNGTYFIASRRFENSKEICLNRLPVSYNPDAPVPVRWLQFLNELM